MKTLFGRYIYWVIMLMAMNVSLPLVASHNLEKTIVISGYIKDSDTKRPLASANITVPGTAIGTVANAEGKFTLKVPSIYQDEMLEVSHIGYSNTSLPINSAMLSSINIFLSPYSNSLSEVIVYSNNPRLIVEEAIRKIPINYSDKTNMLTAFYRETIQKRNHYIGISEAVIDIYKTSYVNRLINKDKVQILKGRRLLSQNNRDTLSVKMAGGPALSIFMDLVKNQQLFLNSNDLMYYEFWMEDPVSIDDRIQLVIGFKPRYKSEIALLNGKLFIDRNELALSRAEFKLDLSDKAKAISTILIKKPMGLRFTPQEVSYIVTYKEKDGKSYLSYINNIIRFKCDWKRRLFATGFKVNTEMVITDRSSENVVSIANKEAFGAREVFYDKVNSYWDGDFWTEYNIIEPTESLENAALRLKKKNGSSVK